MFSDALAPAVVGGIIGSINYLKNHPELLDKLHNNSNYFRDKLQKLGFNTFNSITQVVPILIGEDDKTIIFFNELYNNGLFAPAVRWPAVPRKKGRIRFSIMAIHSKKQIDEALNIIEKVGKKLNII
jgi:glycine C-acetyltransferase